MHQQTNRSTPIQPKKANHPAPKLHKHIAKPNLNQSGSHPISQSPNQTKAHAIKVPKHQQNKPLPQHQKYIAKRSQNLNQNPMPDNKTKHSTGAPPTYLFQNNSKPDAIVNEHLNRVAEAAPLDELIARLYRPLCQLHDKRGCYEGQATPIVRPSRSEVTRTVSPSFTVPCNSNCAS